VSCEGNNKFLRTNILHCDSWHLGRAAHLSLLGTCNVHTVTHTHATRREQEHGDVSCHTGLLLRLLPLPDLAASHVVSRCANPSEDGPAHRTPYPPSSTLSLPAPSACRRGAALWRAKREAASQRLRRAAWTQQRRLRPQLEERVPAARAQRHAVVRHAEAADAVVVAGEDANLLAGEGVPHVAIEIVVAGKEEAA